MIPRKLYSAAAAILAALVVATSAQATRATPPPSFVEQALCVHSGWHYTQHRVRGVKPEYHLFGHWFWRTTKTWSNGEGSWTAVSSSYGGGLQFMLGTWNNAGPPYARSTSDIARFPASVQIEHAWRIVSRYGWGQWPNTSRACGY